MNTIEETRESMGSVTLLIHQLRADDPNEREEAARRVWEHYFRQLFAVAHQRLPLKMRPRVDEEDVLQSVFRSFFRRELKSGYDLSHRDDLWKLLVTITLNKVFNTSKRHQRAKRRVGKEDANQAIDAYHSVPSLEPSPEEAVAMSEAIEDRFESLPEDHLRQVALKKLEGYTNQEIATEFGCCERTIERYLELIRVCWMNQGEATAAGRD